MKLRLKKETKIIVDKKNEGIKKNVRKVMRNSNEKKVEMKKKEVNNKKIKENIEEVKELEKNTNNNIHNNSNDDKNFTKLRTHKNFMDWVNEEFNEYKVDVPDENRQPCFCDNDKVKWRGEWDNDNKNICYEKSGKLELTNHQKFLKAFFKEMVDNSGDFKNNYRGILLYHGLGSGKSGSAIGMVSEVIKDRQVVFMSPKSLRENFVDELKKFGPSEYIIPRGLSKGEAEVYNKKVDKLIERKYFFLSYNSSNLINQMKDIPELLDNKILIVDEVHNLMSMVFNESKKGIFLLDTIMNANNLKIIFLSGTPIINNPYEIALLFNLLVGYIMPDNKNTKFESKGESVLNPKSYFADTTGRRRRKVTLFNDPVEFFNFFIDTSDNSKFKLKNELMFKRRIQGLVSYYSGEQPADNIYPKKYEEIVEIEMSHHQFELYEAARKIERILENRGKTSYTKKKGVLGVQNIDLLGSKSGKKSSPTLFRTFSRQLGNFAFPSDIPRPLPRRGFLRVNDMDLKEEDIKLENIYSNEDEDNEELVDDFGKMNKIDKKLLAEALEKIEEKADVYLNRNKMLPKLSPKFVAMLERIDRCKGLFFVYSQFYQAEGIGLFSKTLRQEGYIEYGYNDPKFNQNNVEKPHNHTRDSVTGKRYDECNKKEKENFKPLTFVRWTEFSGKEYENYIRNIFNSEANKYGHLIKGFLSTKSGVEGISLMNVRQVHLMEPYWHDVLSEQAIGRAVRRCSHAALPPEERTVDVFRYISMHNKYKNKDMDENGLPFSTDQNIHFVAQRKKNINVEITKAMKEASIDCKLNYNHNTFNSDDKLKCFNIDMNDTKGYDKIYRTEIKEETTDINFLSNYKKEKLSLIRIKPSNLRIKDDDLIIFKFYAKKEFDKIEGKEIIFYHPIKDIEYFKVIIKEGVPKKILLNKD